MLQRARETQPQDDDHPNIHKGTLSSSWERFGM